MFLILSQISPQICHCIVVLFLYYRIISAQFKIVAHLRTNSQLELLYKQLLNACLFIPKKINVITASFKTCIINIFCYLLGYSRFGARLKVSLVAPVIFTCNTSNSLQTACCIIRKKLRVETGFRIPTALQLSWRNLLSTASTVSTSAMLCYWDYDTYKIITGPFVPLVLPEVRRY